MRGFEHRSEGACLASYHYRPPQLRAARRGGLEHVPRIAEEEACSPGFASALSPQVLVGVGAAGDAQPQALPAAVLPSGTVLRHSAQELGNGHD